MSGGGRQKLWGLGEKKAIFKILVPKMAYCNQVTELTANYRKNLHFLCQQGGISPSGAEWVGPNPPLPGGNPVAFC